MGKLLLSCALLPLVAAWSSLSSGKHAVARRWTALALALACGQAAYAVVLLMDPRTAIRVPSWLPGMHELGELIDKPPEWALFLGVGSLGAAAAWWTLKVVDARRSSLARPLAGSRIRVPGTTDPAAPE